MGFQVRVPTRLSGRAGGALLLLLTVVPSVRAQDTMAVDGMPSPSELVERYAEAVGGREAFLNLPAIQLTGKLALPARNIEGNLLIARTSEPIQVFTEITIPGIGALRTGYDGNTGWANDPIQGPRVVEGMELDRIRDMSSLAATVREMEFYSEMETLEKAEMNGESCWKVRMVWTENGRESYDCYSIETGLIVATVTMQSSPNGTMEVLTLLSDYKQFGNVLLPTRMDQPNTTGGQVITVTEVIFDDIPNGMFELPPEIRALVAGG